MLRGSIQTWVAIGSKGAKMCFDPMSQCWILAVKRVACSMSARVSVFPRGLLTILRQGGEGEEKGYDDTYHWHARAVPELYELYLKAVGVVMGLQI